MGIGFDDGFGGGAPGPGQNPKVLVMTACRRPEYFARAVSALEHCEGIDAYEVMAFLDGGYPEEQARMVDLLAASTLRAEVFCQRQNRERDMLTFQAFEGGFSRGAEQVILIEEDVVPTVDFLVYMEQTLEALEPFDRMFSVSGYHPTPQVDRLTERPGAGVLEHWDSRIEVPFLPAPHASAVGLWEWSCRWGLGLWRSRWEETIRKHWQTAPGWDVVLCWQTRRNRLSAFPMVSRVQNIGAEDGAPRSREVYLRDHFTENLHQGPAVQHFELEPLQTFLTHFEIEKHSGGNLRYNPSGCYLLPWFTRHIDQRRVETVFEIGSRDLLDAIQLRDYYRARVVAFECNPVALRTCRRHLQGQSGITLVEKAAWNENTTIPFFPVVASRLDGQPTEANIGASSCFRARGGYVEEYIQGETTVEAIRLDDYCLEAGIERVDLICMDVQGAALQVLEGMEHVLTTARYLFIELERQAIYEGQTLFNEIHSWLSARGFRCVEEREVVSGWFSDFLFVR